MRHIKTFESFLNESSKGGPKVQKFLKFAELDPTDLVYFADAEGGQGLHKGWHDAKKKLKLTDANAVICFTDVVSDYNDMMDSAAALTFEEVEESDDDNGGIIFDVNQ